MTSYAEAMGLFPRETRRPNDPENEIVYFEAGYFYDTYGYYCKVSKNGLCVEDFGRTKKSALRVTRRGWLKIKNKKFEEEHGFPRICNDEEATQNEA